MNALAVLLDLAGRPLAALDSFWADLDPARLNAHPGGHPNSPAWLVWHAGREIDAQLSHLTGTQQVWTTRGFDARFDPEVRRNDIGYGHSPEQARAVVVPETPAGKALLRDYLAEVVAAARAYLTTLTDTELDGVIDERWDPPVTRAVRLVSLFDDALQHIGQAAYVAGMRTT